MAYMTRLPGSDDVPVLETKKKSRYLGENDCVDERALLIMGFAERCRGCGLAVRVRYLENGTCPDCRGVVMS